MDRNLGKNLDGILTELQTRSSPLISDNRSDGGTSTHLGVYYPYSVLCVREADLNLIGEFLCGLRPNGVPDSVLCLKNFYPAQAFHNVLMRLVGVTHPLVSGKRSDM